MRTHHKSKPGEPASRTDGSPRSTKQRLSIAAVLLSTLALGIYVGSRAEAEGIPRNPSMYYSGLLEEDGIRVDAVRAFTLRFWSGPSSGATEVCTAITAPDVAVDDGHFSIRIGDECTNVVHDRQDVWTELQVGSETPLPRARLGAVPYAVEAEQAEGARQAVEATPLDARLTALEEFADRTPLLSDVATFSTSGTTSREVPELALELDTHGQGVSLTFVPGDPTQGAFIEAIGTSGGDVRPATVRIEREDVSSGTSEIVAILPLRFEPGSRDSFLRLRVPPGSLSTTDHPAAGRHRYRVFVNATVGTSAVLSNIRLQAWEGR